MRTQLAVGLFLSLISMSAATARDWSGPYIGAHIGYAWGEASNTWRSPGAGFIDWQPDGDIAYDSAFGGGYLGYLAQFGAFVIGVEADISRTSLKGDDSQFAGLVNAIELNYVGTLRARAGLAHGNSLFYATAGYAYSDYDKKDRTLGWSDSENLSGWTVGAGIEHAFWGKWSGRLEYQYIDLGSAESNLTDGLGAYYHHRATNIEVQSVRAGIAYGF